MEFVLIVKSNGKQPSPSEMQQMLKEYQPWMEKWKENGNYIEGSPFLPNGIHIVEKDNYSDQGDFLSQVNIITGYIKIEVENLDKAIEVANSCPLLHCNEIFVRPLLEMK